MINLPESFHKIRTHSQHQQEAKELYANMAQEIGLLSTAEAAEVNILKNADRYHGKPFTEYLKDPLELGARKVQFEAFKNPTFQN